MNIYNSWFDIKIYEHTRFSDIVNKKIRQCVRMHGPYGYVKFSVKYVKYMNVTKRITMVHLSNKPYLKTIHTKTIKV